MNLIEKLNFVYDSLLKGIIPQTLDFVFMNEISNYSVFLINSNQWTKDDIICADLIIRISNVLYNNTSLDVLPLDDGVYDQLIVKYRLLVNESYQVGALPIKFNESPQNEIQDMKVMCEYVPDKDVRNNIYFTQIKDQFMYKDPRFKTMCIINRDPIKKRLINAPHNYPELVGTLDKCKFVLNDQAIQSGVFDKESVQIFERDFIHKHLNSGIINPTERFIMIGELKYDGVSVEATIKGDTLISALSRGDTADNVASDLTPILGGYKFPFAKGIDDNEEFGIKFEAIISKRDLDRMSQIRGKSYKNCRNAIIGLLGSSDAYLYRDFITLIPLATSYDIGRIAELDFLNKYYNSGEYNRYCIFEGNYQDILFHVNQFTDAADKIRPILPYLIDGVVISYIDKNKIEALGRINSVNKYSIAIKFNAKKVRTIFLGYTFTVGKTGDITPMAHFKPCEFIGTIHTEQTVHSYKRFKELSLRKGDEIDVEYVNEVICYVTKPDTEHNRNNSNVEPEPFIDKCPYCGSDILISDTGKSAKCINNKCPERTVKRMTDMITQLGFKGFGEETVRALNLNSFNDLVYAYNNPDILDKIGPINKVNFLSYLDNLMKNPIYDYKIMSALCFENMGEEKWKTILNVVTISEIYDSLITDIHSKLKDIPNIGNSTIEGILIGMLCYNLEIETIINMGNIINSKGMSAGEKISISGFRDDEFIELLNNNGFDASDKYGVTKKTSYLIVADKNSSSGKISNAKKYGIPIMTKEEFLNDKGIKF